jgi:hypothetical protein
MPERGTPVQMPRAAQMVLRGLEYFTWPLRLDDYLEPITPLWSTNEARGRIERVCRETGDSVTVAAGVSRRQTTPQAGPLPARRGRADHPPAHRRLS